MQKRVGMVMVSILVFATDSRAQTDTIVADEKSETIFRSHRILGGVKAKLGNDLTIGSFGAVYLGDGPQYKVASRSNPYSYNGWDFVPGFSVELGEITNGIKLSSGGDLYILRRVFQKGREQLEEYRPRWNVALTKPFSFGGSIQWTSRFERSMQGWYQFADRENANGEIAKVKELTQKRTIYRYRSALKLSAPQYTAWKLSPYIYSESFNEREPIDYYSESELGLSFTPVKGLSISLADNFQLKFRADEIVQNHMICLYASYTADLSGLSLFSGK